METATKVLLIIAACLIVLGSLLFVTVMSVAKWDFTVLGAKYETIVYTPSADFNSISVNTDTADVFFAPSEDESCRVVCLEQEKVTHSVTVADGVLCIQLVDNRAWYEHISIYTKASTVTVYLPKSEYASLCVKADTSDVEIPKGFNFGNIEVCVSTGDVRCLASSSNGTKIGTSTGKILIESVSVGSLDLVASTGDITATSVACGGDISVNVSTGKVRFTDVTCKNLTSSGGTGDITLTNAIASEKFSIERSTGDVTFEGCDASSLTVKTGTGDVRGALLTEKIFFTSTRTGTVNVPKCTSGGTCDIATSTGDITIEIKL